MNKLLEELQVVTTEDVANHLDITKEHASVYLHRLMEQGKTERIRKGMYYIKTSTSSKRPPNQYVVAHKIAPDSVICYHSALELHGVAHQVFYTVYVHTSKRFNPFHFRNVQYRHAELRNPEFAVDEMHVDNHSIKRTTLERTIVDCAQNLRFSGGWDEFFNSINVPLEIDLLKMITDIRETYPSKSAYKKMGFLLDTMKEMWDFNESLFENMREVILNHYVGHEELKRVRKFSESISPNIELELNKVWNIKIPKPDKEGGDDFW